MAKISAKAKAKIRAKKSKKKKKKSSRAKVCRLTVDRVVYIDYKDVAAFSILAIVLIFLPSGLLGKPEIEKV